MCAYYTKIHAKTLSPGPEKHSSEFFKKAMDASSRVTLCCRREPKQAINEFTRKGTKMLKIEFKVGNAAFREEDEDGNDRLINSALRLQTNSKLFHNSPLINPSAFVRPTNLRATDDASVGSDLYLIGQLTTCG